MSYGEFPATGLLKMSYGIVSISVRKIDNGYLLNENKYYKTKSQLLSAISKCIEE